ncbi:MAG TPA: phage tail tube protein [Aliidongia sp.]|nr:phage tail tube protein [Aliidongia sp.]
MAQQRTGRAFVRANGTLYETLDGAKLSNIAGIERSAVTGAAVFGFTEKTAIPTIDCDFAHGPGVSVATLIAMTDVTITFECDSGVTFVLGDAWCSKGGDLAADGSAKLTVQFMALTCQEQGTTG